MKRGTLWVILSGLVIAGLLAGACAPPTTSAPGSGGASTPAPKAKAGAIVIKGVSFLPVNHVTSEPFKKFISLVNERAKGDLTIEYTGGPEAIPTFEQAEAVRTGVIDIRYGPANYLKGIAPEVYYYYLSTYSPIEERKVGLYDYWDEVIGKKMNNRYLGNIIGGPDTPFFVFTNIKAQKPEDLSGKRFRTAPVYINFFEALGINPVNMAGGEIYEAMERKLVDGYAWPLYAGFVEMGLPAVTKYMIDHPFYTGDGIVTVNLNKWNSIPKPMQDVLKQASADTEVWSQGFLKELGETQRQKAKAAGLEFIKFSEADAQRYLKTAYDAAWKDMEKELGSEAYNKQRKLMTK